MSDHPHPSKSPSKKQAVRIRNLVAGLAALCIAAVSIAFALQYLNPADNKADTPPAHIESSQPTPEQSEQAMNTDSTTTPSLDPDPAPDTVPDTDKPVISQSPEELVDPALAAAYLQAETLLAEGKIQEAAIAFGRIPTFADALDRSLSLWSSFAVRETVSAGNLRTVGLLDDGTATAFLSNAYTQCDVSSWSDLVAVSAGGSFALGLRSDGTVLYTGSNKSGEGYVSSWNNIVAIAAGNSHSVGLKCDGTVVATGWNLYGQCDVEDWTDIIAIAADSGHTLGLRSDGTVVAVGNNDIGQCDVQDWHEITAISCGFDHSVGLRNDGTVIAAGNNDNGQCTLEDWHDITAVSTGMKYTIGLRSDGTVAAAGYNVDGQCDVGEWDNIAAISAGTYFSVGLRYDGTVAAASRDCKEYCDVSSWQGIRVPDASAPDISDTTPLSQETLDELSAWLSQPAHYGFLLSQYEDVRDVSLHLVFYSGAGLTEYGNEDHVQQAMAPVHTDITCLNEDDMDALLRQCTGYGLDEIRNPPEYWTYLEEYGLYAHQHGDTNRNSYVCTDGYRAMTDAELYVVNYMITQPWFNTGEDGNTYLTHSGTVVLQKVQNGYRFLSNTLHPATE